MSKNRYHFSLGNSTDGPIGFCAAVVAASEEEAVAKLVSALPGSQEIGTNYGTGADIEYIEAYINTDAITAAAIDEEWAVTKPEAPSRPRKLYAGNIWYVMDNNSIVGTASTEALADHILLFLTAQQLAETM